MARWSASDIEQLAWCAYLFKAMIYANLSYHTFWNAVIMYRYWICGNPWNKIYFRVNRWDNQNWFPFTAAFFQMTMLCSLCFIWGYSIFRLIVLIRMKFYARKKTLYWIKSRKFRTCGILFVWLKISVYNLHFILCYFWALRYTFGIVKYVLWWGKDDRLNRRRIY